MVNVPFKCKKCKHKESQPIVELRWRSPLAHTYNARYCPPYAVVCRYCGWAHQLDRLECNVCVSDARRKDSEVEEDNCPCYECRSASGRLS